MSTTPPTALILGASGSIGSAIANELLARGYQLGLHYHAHEDPCRAIIDAAAAKNLRAASYKGDFSTPTAPNDIIAAFLKDFGRADAVVYAVGIARCAPLISLPEEDLRAMLDVNLRGFFLTLKALSRQFMKQKSGSVAAVSSHAALGGRAGGAGYAMAHAGLLALVKSAARELGAFGVRVNAVLPPFIADSPMGRASTPEFAAAIKSRTVLKSDFDARADFARFVANTLEQPGLSGQVLKTDSRIAP